MSLESAFNLYVNKLHTVKTNDELLKIAKELVYHSGKGVIEESIEIPLFCLSILKLYFDTMRQSKTTDPVINAYAWANKIEQTSSAFDKVKEKIVQRDKEKSNVSRTQ